MTQEKVDIYLMTHSEYFPSDKLTFLRDKLILMPDDKAGCLSFIELQKPIVSLLFSLYLGGLGVDRFIIGDIGMGVLKLLTGGCCGILTIIDWFTIMNKTKEKNFDKIWQVIQ